MKGDMKMETTSNTKQEIGRVMYRMKMSRRQLVALIADKNSVTPKTVYKWLRNEDPVKEGVILETLKDIESPKVSKEYTDDFFES